MFSTEGGCHGGCTVGVILSTLKDTQYNRGFIDAGGGYHEYYGGVQYGGRVQSFVISVPPLGTRDIPHLS